MDSAQQHQDMLRWIDAQHDRMIDAVTALANINSGTMNLAGLAAVASQLKERFETLGAPCEEIDLPLLVEIDARGNESTTKLGQALRFHKQPHRHQPGAPRVFLCIHYDTVYSGDHPFQKCEKLDANTLRGPGVTDAKGGIIVMLAALEAIERSPWRELIAWEVLLNPDEEIGTPGSAHLLSEAASRHDIGLLFEPALETGGFAAPRKGSGNFTLIVRGKAAHAGRYFDQGRNAMHLIAKAVVELAAVNGMKIEHPGLTLNVGKIEGGGPVNIVPDLAIARFNCRVATAQQQAFIEQKLEAMLSELNAQDGYHAQLHGAFHSPPKPIDAKTLSLLESLRDSGKTLNLNLDWQPTGGVCDGNKLAAAGLANVDTLGPRGHSIHSENETLHLDSLTERAKLTALLLARIGKA